MVLLREIKKRARHITGPLLAIAVFGYFSYHSIQGDRGLVALVHVSQQTQIANANFDKVARERLALERRTNLLRPDHLDPDLLNERVRTSLGFLLPNEIVIMDGAATSAPMSAPGAAPVAPAGPRVTEAQATPTRAPAAKGLAAQAVDALPAVRAQVAQLAELANKMTVSFASAR